MLPVLLGAGARGDHLDRGGNRARLRVRPALQGFSVCRADHGGAAVFDADAAQPAESRARGRSRKRCSPGCWRHRCSIPASTKARTIGSRCGPARCICCWRLRCGRRGPCKPQNKQPDRQARQADIVEHDAETGGDQPAGQQHDRRPHQMQRRDHKRDDAEHRVLEQRPSPARASCTARSAARHRRPAPPCENSIAR